MAMQSDEIRQLTDRGRRGEALCRWGVTLWVGVALCLSASTTAQARSLMGLRVVDEAIVGAAAAESAEAIIVNRCEVEADLVILVTPFVATPPNVPEEVPATMRLHLLPGQAATFPVPLPPPSGAFGRRYSSIEVGAEPGRCAAPGLHLIHLASVVKDADRGTVERTRGFGFVETGRGSANAVALLGKPLNIPFHIGEDEAAEVAVVNNCESDITFQFTVRNLGPSSGAETYDVFLEAGQRGVVPLRGHKEWITVETINWGSHRPAAQCSPEHVISTINGFSTDDKGTVDSSLLITGALARPDL